MSDVYCNVENVFLEPGESFRYRGATVHVVDDFQGHTLEGWPATWKGVKRPHGDELAGGTVDIDAPVIEQPQIDQPEIDIPDAEPQP